MRVRIRHQTRYLFERPALLGPHVVRLHPAEHAKARLLSHNLAIEPRPEIRWQYDAAANRIARATWPAGKKTSELGITVDIALEIHPINPFDFFVEDGAKEIPFPYPSALAAELSP